MTLYLQVSVLTHIASNWLNCAVEAERLGTAHPSIVPYQVCTTFSLPKYCSLLDAYNSLTIQVHLSTKYIQLYHYSSIVRYQVCTTTQLPKYSFLLGMYYPLLGRYFSYRVGFAHLSIVPIPFSLFTQPYQVVTVHYPTKYSSIPGS